MISIKSAARFPRLGLGLDENHPHVSILRSSISIFQRRKSTDKASRTPFQRFFSCRHSLEQESRWGFQLKAKLSTTATSRPDFRLAMRQLAYPVVILTVTLEGETKHLHGSTISSFTPIAMKPEPIISVSIQTPSRLCDYLSATTSTTNSIHQPFTVHLLNHNPSSIRLATLFSKPKNRFSPEIFDQLDRISAAKLDCQILHHLKLPPPLTNTTTTHPKPSDTSEVNCHGHSTLFIARVNHFSFVSNQKPLLYFNQEYTTVC